MSGRTYTAAEKRAFAARMAAARKAKKASIYRTPAPPRPRRPKVTQTSITGSGTYKMQSPSLSAVGGELGRWLGKGADKIVKTLFGFGDYHIEHNSLIEGGLSPPQIINSIDRGGFIIRHREYIMDIEATTDFTVQTLAINPALEESFPWLATVAEAFEEYEFRGLVYEFKSMSSDALLSATTSTALGTVIMATQYNSLNPSFTTKVQMENYEFANSSKPSCDFLHPVECKRSLTPVTHLYTRSGPAAAGGDLRLYDLGEFQIATQGMQAASGVIGELWCTFEIELYKPKLIDDENQILSARWRLTNVTNASPLGSGAAVIQDDSTLECEITGGTITFPATLTEGKFRINYNCVGTSAAVTTPTITALTNCTKIANQFINNTANQFSTQNGVSVTGYICMFNILITGPSAVVTFSDDGVFPSSATSGDLAIFQYNTDLT